MRKNLKQVFISLFFFAFIHSQIWFTDSLDNNGSELSSTTCANNLETSTATTVQELDSSKKREETGSPDAIQENANLKEEEFTIIHIPEEQSNENTNEHQMPSVNAESEVQKIAEEMSTELTSEQRFAMMVENLDLDLIVKTYEALQSSENVDSLIENWLANCNETEGNGVDELTLEENLKRFIQFSKQQSELRIQ